MVPIRSAVVLALVVAAATARVLSGREVEVRRSLRLQRGNVGIYGGRNTTIEKHPYLMALLLNGEWYCAATILTKEWAITIANCTVGLPITFFTLVANSTDGIHGTAYNLSQYIMHPRYDFSSTKDYDFTCLKIDGKFKWSKTVQPVRLPRKQPKLNTRFNVAGYGSYSYEPGSSWGLSEAWMTWTSKKPCVEYFGERYNITPRMGCAYGVGNATLCNGDFADGFVKNGVIYGMFAYGKIDYDHPCDPTWPVLLANIKPVTRWIRAITGAKYDDE